MTIAREKYIKIITDKLAYLSSLIKMRNASNLTDISIILEQDFCGLLNLLYDYELVDMNRNGNYPVIDLADLRNRIAVQITAQKKRHKIVKTIHDFIR